MNNLHTSWRQGYFVDKAEYGNWSDEEKKKAAQREKLLVRPYPEENAICQCNTPAEAKWIADRLNLAATLEQMTHAFTEEEKSNPKKGRAKWTELM